MRLGGWGPSISSSLTRWPQDQRKVPKIDTADVRVLTTELAIFLTQIQGYGFRMCIYYTFGPPVWRKIIHQSTKFTIDLLFVVESAIHVQRSIFLRLLNRYIKRVSLRNFRRIAWVRAIFFFLNHRVNWKVGLKVYHPPTAILLYRDFPHLAYWIFMPFQRTTWMLAIPKKHHPNIWLLLRKIWIFDEFSEFNQVVRS